MNVRVTPAVAADWSSRLVDELLPYSEPGVYDVTDELASFMLADAEFYCDPDGPGQACSLGQRGAYRALARQLRAKGVQPTAPVQEEEARDELGFRLSQRSFVAGCLERCAAGTWARYGHWQREALRAGLVTPTDDNEALVVTDAGRQYITDHI